MIKLFLLTASILVISAMSEYGPTCSEKMTGNRYELNSPDSKITAVVDVATELTYRIAYEGKEYVAPSAIAMKLADGAVLGRNAEVASVETKTADRVIRPVYGITDSVKDNYNELTVHFDGGYSVSFRAYNEGFAYRFATRFNDSITVVSETCEFGLHKNDSAYFHPSLSEADYRLQKISDIERPNYSSLPLLVKAGGGLNILLHESDVLDYPCLSVSVDSSGRSALIGRHANVPTRTEPGGHANFNLVVKETENFIARTSGARSFPWRLLAFEKDDKDILTNQLVYLLASENRLSDVSWIKPGKVSWDWWNEQNLTGVSFKTGFNTETYKYYIDFAAANGIQYINMDEGWSDQFDLLKVTQKLDVPALIAYAKARNVGVILWCVWYTLDRQMMAAMDQFEKWGVSGLKVDFMDRDDQVVVNFHERLVKEAAKRKLLINFHGAYHPTGMSRTYPNLINVEGVKGLEWNKFDSLGTSPKHDVTIPFIRMFAGSMDYTPGAMQNYNRTDWKANYFRPASQGTRCHQLAMYTVYFAPLQMLADAPTTYEREPMYLKYLSSIPTSWNQTVPLAGKVGEYVSVARRNGNTWYLAAMTNWEQRNISATLHFLKANATYSIEVFKDGPNADRVGSDYVRFIKEVKKDDTIHIQMAPGGGWSAKLTLQ